MTVSAQTKGVGPTAREATVDDAEAIADLWTEAYVTRGVGTRTELYLPADFTDADKRGWVFVVDGDDRLGGVVVLYPPTDPGRVVAETDEAELARLAVALPLRRSGIGRALIDLCEQQARAAEWGGIALWSRLAQTEAHRLYETAGYRRAPQRDSVDTNGHERLVFRLSLAEQPVSTGRSSE